MEKFYYIAVSNTAKKKLMGSVLSESERDAREKLNKIGMAILLIAKEKPAEWNNEDSFEFAVLDKVNKEFAGEIIAENQDEVFDRLANEFEFKKINYIYRTSASEEEKAKARESSVKEIIFKKQQEEEKKEDQEKRTLMGSLKHLATMKVGEGEENKENKIVENLKKFSNEGEEDLTKKTAADVAEPDKSDAQKIKKVDIAEESKKTYSQREDSPDAEAKEDSSEEEPSKKVSVGEQVQNLKSKFVNFFPNFSKKFGNFYFLLTEIIVPPKDKTRNDALKEMKNFFFPSKDPAEIAKEKSKAVMKRKAVFERFWISLEEIVDVLAAVFIAYFAIGTLALYVEIPRISEIAENTLHGNFMIPFFAGVFVFLRLLILIREKFTSWSPLRTSLLFITGTMLIVFAAMNLL